MGLKGDVRSLSLANVLQDLAMNEQTGTLYIRGKTRQVALWFERGALRLVGLDQGEGPSLANGLLALEKIAPEDLPAASGRRTSERSLLRSLMKQGRIKAPDLKAALEHQMGEHVCDTFLWSDATFEFEEGPADNAAFDLDQLDLEPRIVVDGLILEAVRRSDEWHETRKAIFTSREIFVPDPTQQPPEEADATTRRVLGLMTGERTLAEIQSLTRLGQFAIHRSAAQLLRAGTIRPLSTEQACERARDRVKRKEWDSALHLIHYGLEHERTNTALLELAFRCAEGREDPAAAAGYARQLASVQFETGRLEDAISSYRKVLVHAPRDLVARERLLGIMLELDLKADALSVGEELAAAYKRAGLTDKTLDVYQRLVEKIGDRPDLLEALADAQRHLGDTREAIDNYRKLLARALEIRDDKAALDCCRTILKMAPHHDEALRISEALETGALDKARRKRRARKIYIVLAILAVLAGTAAWYEWSARDLLAELRVTIPEHTLAGDFGKALDDYDRLLEAYPLSLAAREVRASGEREKIEERYTEEQLEEANWYKRTEDLLRALEILDQALKRVHREDLLEKLQARHEEFSELLSSQEKRWQTRLAGMTPEEIGAVREPTAVGALGKLLADERPERRTAAVAALGGIEGDAATAALVKALAVQDLLEPAAAQLKRRTGKDFGTDRLKWEEWWAKAAPATGQPPLRAALLASHQAFGPDDPVTVEWRVTNFDIKEMGFTLEPEPIAGLRIIGPDGKPRTLPRPKGVPLSRRLSLPTGEFMGGTFDVGSLMKAPGTYRVTWSIEAILGGKRLAIEASPLVLERKKP